MNTINTLSVRELSAINMAEVAGGSYVGACVVGAGAGGFAGGFIGALPGAAIGAIVGCGAGMLLQAL
jgi:hypothetical protein